MPRTITTDQGRQFESGLFKRLTSTFGIERLRTTSYHPQPNGMVERFHRHLKAAIICHPESSWLQALPLVLLGIRNVYREDLTTSSAELVYGEPLRLPGSLLASPPGLGRSEDISDLVIRLQRQTSRLQPVSGSAHSKPQTFVFQELSTCTHVFLRDDTVRRALQPPYSGPHKVLSRDDKTMTIQIADRSSKVSIDRVKPAYILPDPSPKPQPRSAHTPVPSIDTPAADPDNATPEYATRFGRNVRLRLDP
ncbi:uncharacterized protein LOC124368128 [Homalodisca vitripennis]|uniref:uncharacterized protein LOC124368128 n=1 Tax=Homalodisca vitripennis TaxID=197043 RepID=UPI001EEB9695|nr:uncharacterized protein LOC124368128 [Homalodisca vitripennis]